MTPSASTTQLQPQMSYSTTKHPSGALASQSVAGLQSKLLSKPFHSRIEDATDTSPRRSTCQQQQFGGW